MYSLTSRTFFTWNMACILPVAHTRNYPEGQVVAWAITEFQSSSRTANAIWQWAKVGRYHVSVKIRHELAG